MDISVNENVIEKVRLRDIFASLKNIIAGDKTSEDEKITDKKLQEIYKAEKELGATDSIANLTKELEMQEAPKKKKSARNTEKVTKINNPVKEKINSKNKEEIQEEGKEL
ncbi:MAG: hypothetical protein ACI4VO_06155 [Clostridia bacterium]